MSTNSISVDFLPGGARKKWHTGVHIFILCMLVMNMSMIGVFFVAYPAAAVVCGGADADCEAYGFDYAVAKWEWNDGHYYVDGSANGTDVTGDDGEADWTADPAVDGVISKAGQDYEEHTGGTSGTITAGDYNISHLTFCANEPYCEMVLLKSDDGYDPVAPGGEIVYHLTLTNIGTANCTGGGVGVKDIFGEHTSYTNASPESEQLTDEYIKWNFGVLEPGETAEMELTMTVDGCTPCDTVIKNKAKYWSDQTGWGEYVIEETLVECVPDPVCGDGIENQDHEECDWGQDNGLICDPEYGSECTYCSEICSEITLTGPYCGDEVKNGNEECDTEDEVGDNQICSPECEIIDLEFCGDEEIDEGEECDDGPYGSDACTTECTYRPITIKGFKVICESEEYLPNWGLEGAQPQEPSQITPGTAADYVVWVNAQEDEDVCFLASGWDFQWGYDGQAEKQDGSHIGPAPAGTGWQDFTSSTDGSNPAEIVIDYPDGKLWARENLQTGYIPYANPPAGLQEDYSAELHCHTDILNFDNYDYINNIEPGGTYYCVAFNAPVPSPTTGTLIVKKLVAGGEAASAEWTMHIGQDISFPGSVSGTATELEPAMYQVTESAGPDNYLLTYSGDCGESGYVTVSVGETSTCILTNTWHEPPPQIGHLTVKKVVVGGDATSSDWTMQVGDSVSFPGSLEGETRGYAPAMYQVTESGEMPNYNLAYSGDCGEAGHVDVVPGEDKECILTNTYEEPPLGSIEVCKYLDSDGLASTTEDRGLATTTGWTFRLNYGQNEIIHETASGCTAFIDLASGDYKITEDAAVGWSLMEPASGSTTVALAVGENIQISFVNTIEIVPEPVCGNSIIEAGEACDDGSEGSATCTIECTLIPVPGPECGNNIKETGEECDGIDTQAGRSCTASCALVPTGGGGGLLIPPVRTVASEEPEVLGEEGIPALVLEKTINLPFANAGDIDVPYKIVITNNGGLTAFTVILSDDLPAGFTYSGTDSGFKVWELGDIEPGKNIVVEYQVDIALDVTAGIYTNTAVATAINHPAVNGSADIEVRTVDVLAETLPATGFSVEEFMAILLSILALVGVSGVLKHKIA